MGRWIPGVSTLKETTGKDRQDHDDASTVKKIQSQRRHRVCWEDTRGTTTQPAKGETQGRFLEDLVFDLTQMMSRSKSDRRKEKGDGFVQKSEKAWIAQGKAHSWVCLEVWGEALWHDDNGHGFKSWLYHLVGKVTCFCKLQVPPLQNENNNIYFNILSRIYT